MSRPSSAVARSGIIALVAVAAATGLLALTIACKARSAGLSRRRLRDLRNGLLFISPWIVGFGGFVLYPVGASLYYALTDFSVLQAPIFIGAGTVTIWLHYA